MQTEYLLLIDRKSGDKTDFTDLPFGDLEKLVKVADAALKIPYVNHINISKKVGELMKGHPLWGQPFYLGNRNKVTGSYTTEEQFKQDLRAALQNDALFAELYANKEEWKRFTQSLR